MSSVRKNTVADFLQFSAMTILIAALMKGSERQISQVSESYANILRIAAGEALPTEEERAFNKFERDFMADPDSLPQQEHALNLALGLEREPVRDVGYYARGLVGAMHGRKKSIHRGGPDHDPIWGETQ